MPNAWLQEDVYMAVRHPDLVVLDARTGDYLCLPELGRVVTVTDGAAGLEISDPEIRDSLAELQLIGFEARGGNWPVVAAPARDLSAPPGADLSARDALDLLKTCLAMLRVYRGRSFPDLMRAARRPAAGLRWDEPAAAATARAFQAALPWIPFQGDCLFRSVFLRELLRARGLGATWVIGVQTWPFEAHCWLQAGDLVLDDTAEHAQGFTRLAAF